MARFNAIGTKGLGIRGSEMISIKRLILDQRRPSGYSHLSKLYRVALLSTVFLLFPATALPDNDDRSVVILNSNAAIKKYALIQETFQANTSKPVKIIDLGNDRNDAATVKAAIAEPGVKLIYAIGSNAYLWASEFADKQKIVHSSVLNWRRMPKKNTAYGVSSELPAGMQLMMFRYLFPDIKTIGVVYNAKFNKEWIDEAVSAAKDVQMNIVGQEIEAPEDLPAALEKLLPKVDVLWLISDPVVLSTEHSAEEIFKRSDNVGKPVFAYSEIFADSGAVLAISADVPTMGMQAAALADDLLAGKTPSDQVLNPAGSQITLNMNKLKAFKMKLNPAALDSVNRIIE